MPMNLDIDPLDLVDPARFALHGYPHEVWARLRAEAPVAYIEPPGHPPFWAVTKHADVQYAASQPQLFSSAGGITLDMDLTGIEMPAEMIVYLDPPEHGPMRQVANKKFLRSAVKARSEEIERIAAGIVDRASTGGEIGECDFVDTFAAPFPVAVISWVLGVPPADWEHHFRWTNEIIGKDDPEYRRPGESPEQTSMRARGELHRYFKAMVEERRDDPQDDLVTQLVQSEIDGVPLNQPQLSPTANYWSRRETRPPVTPSPAACRPSASSPTSGRSCGPTPSSYPRRSRRSCAGSLRSAISRGRPPRTANSTASTSGPATRWRCTGPRPTATRMCSTTPSTSASIAHPASRWCSASVRTCAWAPMWLGPS